MKKQSHCKLVMLVKEGHVEKDGVVHHKKFTTLGPHKLQL